MKYVALWIGIAAALGLVACLIALGFVLVVAIADGQVSPIVPAVVLFVSLVATVATVVDYMSDHRTPKDQV